MAHITDLDEKKRTDEGTAVSPFSSLRFRLSLILILILIPAAVFLVFDVLIIQQRVKAEAENELLRLSQMTAATYQQRLDEAHRIMAAIALFPEVRDGDAEACSARLAQMVELYQPRYPDFGVTNQDGEVICTAVPLATAVQVSDRFWFQETIRTGDFAVGEFTVGRTTGNLVLGLGLPILDENGRVTRVLGHGLWLDSLQEQAEDLPIPPDTVLTITDHNGIILAHVPDGEQWMGQSQLDDGFRQMQAQGEGIMEAVGVDGVERLYAFTAVTGPGNTPVWLTLGQTSDAIYAEVGPAIARDTLGIAAILLVAMTAVWLGSNRLLLRKIDRLVDASERLSQGDLTARVPATLPGNELDQLAFTFNNMAEAVQQREQLYIEHQQQQDFLDRIVGNAPIAIAVLKGHNLEYVSVNPAYQAIMGADVPLVGRTYRDVFPQSAERGAEESLRQVMRTGQPWKIRDFETEIPGRPEMTWWEGECLPLPNEQGEFESVLVLTWEITERKHAEEALRASENRLQAITDTVPALISYVDTEHRYRFVNETYNDWFGYAPNEIIGKHVREVLGQAAYETILPLIERVLSGEPLTIDRLIPYKDGGSRYVLVNYVPDKDANETVQGYFSLVQDITKRKRVESNLAFLAEISQDLTRLTAIDEMMAVLGAKIGEYFKLSRCLLAEVNEAANEARITYEWHREEMPTMAGIIRLSDVASEEFMQMLRAGETIIVRDVQADPRINAENTTPLKIASAVNIPLLRDGQWRFTLAIYDSVPRDWRDDEIELMRELTTRIWTRLEHARAEEALRVSEERLQIAQKAGNVGVWDWNAATGKTYWSETMWHIHGYEQGQPEKIWEAAHHPKDRQRVQEKIAQFLASTEVDYQDEFRIIQPDGSVRWIEATAQLLRDKAGRPVRMSGINLDITERKLTELRLWLLAQVSEMVRQMADPDDFLFAMAQLMGEHLQVQRSFFAEIDQANDRGLIRRDYYQGLPSVAGEYRVSDYSPEAGREIEAGHTVVNRDSQADPRTAALYETVYAPNGERAYVAVPLMREGQRAAVFWVSTDMPRNWSAEEVSLLEAVAERAWLAVEKRQSEEALHRSYNTFLNLIQDAPFGVYLVDADFRLVQVSGGSQKVFSNVRPLLGRNLAEVLRIIWPEPFASEAIAHFQHTLATGEPYHSPDTTEQRRDIAIIESYDWEIQRVIMPDGNFGVVCYFYETTAQVQAGDDAHFLADFTELVRLAETPDQIVEIAVTMAGRYLRLDRCYISEVDEARDRWWVRDDYCAGLPSLAGEYRISDYPAYIVTDARAGRILIAEDASTDPRSASLYAATYKPIGICAHVVVPLIRDGRWQASLVAATSTPHAWQPREITLLETIAERIWNAVEKLRLDAQLRQSEERFRNMANIVPSMVWTADPDGTISFANEERFRYDGITPEQNARGWPELVLHPDDYERWLAVWINALQTGTEFEIEVRNRRHDGVYRWFLSRARATRDEAGRITAWFGITTDIHERKLAEQRGHFLAEATRTLATSLDMNLTLQEVARLAVPELADWCTLNLLQPDGTIRLVAVAHRYPEQEARLWSLAKDYPLQPEAADGTPHVIRTGEPELHDFTADGQPPAQPLPTWAQEDGVRSLLIVPLKSYGRTYGAFSLVRTETGRHFSEDDLALAEEVARRAALALENAQLYEAEQQAREFLEVRVRERTAELQQSSAQLRELMARLQTTREEEQTRLSRELHDQLGGALTILKMDIFQIQRKTTDSERQAELGQLLALVDETIDLTRQLSRELRPAILDYLGLAAALEWQLQEFEKRAGIRGRLLAEEMERRVDGEVATAVFRVVQEALTNIARHAQASKVNIRLQQDAEYLLLEVQDNGRGIRPEEMADGKSLGLLGMRERVRLFAGEVEIDGAPGMGTAVRVKIPFQDGQG